jgi:hypothetical protein
MYFRNDYFKPGRKYIFYQLRELLGQIQLKNKDKREESKNMTGLAKADEIRLLTKRREEELIRARQAFHATMQHIYSHIS